MPLSDRQSLDAVESTRGGGAAWQDTWFCLRIVHKYMQATFCDLVDDLLKGLHGIIVGHVEFIALYPGRD